MKSVFRNVVFLCALFWPVALVAKPVTVLTAPAGSALTHINRGGATVIPNGRFVTPMGHSVSVAPHPFGLALALDGSIAVTANSGISPLSISIIQNPAAAEPKVVQVPPGAKTDDEVLSSVFMGLAIAPDNSVVYVSGGQQNKVIIFDLASGKRVGEIDCASEATPDGYLGDMVLSHDGSRLYVVDQSNFQMLVLDTVRRKVIYRVAVGRYPFGIALAPDESSVYVANVGMFEYSKIPGIDEQDVVAGGLDYPAFGFPSKDATQGTEVGKYKVPGLGDPNAPASFSVWSIDLRGKTPRTVAKIKTGHLVGQPVAGIPAVGGASPNSLAATDRYVFVTNGNNDSVSVIDIRTNRVVKDIDLRPFPDLAHFRGVIPFGVAVSPDMRRLYVAESGINAVAVIDIPSLRVIGHIPVGWFPAKLKVMPNGKQLLVANAKGYGSGPNGGKDFKLGPEGSYIGSLMKGTVETIDIPTDAALAAATEKVRDNNFRVRQSNDPGFAWREHNPVPLFGGERQSPIKHIVFISKENRTFDEIFGQIEDARRDPALARYGEHATFTNKKGDRKVTNATVMPNHLKLARQFALADNFYVDSDVSADGHRWLVNTYPNEWVETTTQASYGGNRSYKPELKAPGALAMNGSAGAIYPEDYNEAGSMWEHMDRHGIPFYNFGFGVMFEPASYDKSYTNTGIRYFANYPLPEPMFDRTSKTYPTYNTAIPDQFRIDRFIEEFNARWVQGNDEMPAMITVIIPNDHGAGERPEAGYPFRESYMADNDLALGRIVEFLSHTKYWRNMAIIVAEDDAQNGVDHIDAHRSGLLVISPWVKHGYVGHVHYSFGSLFKTYWNILGLPWLNQYDAGATDLADMFTAKVDPTPYNAVPSDKRIFDPEKALDPFDKDFDWKAAEESTDMDDPHEMLKESKERDEDRLEHRERN